MRTSPCAGFGVPVDPDDDPPLDDPPLEDVPPSFGAVPASGDPVEPLLEVEPELDPVPGGSFDPSPSEPDAREGSPDPFTPGSDGSISGVRSGASVEAQAATQSAPKATTRRARRLDMGAGMFLLRTASSGKVIRTPGRAGDARKWR